MYKLTEKLADFLVKNAKDAGLKTDELNPYVPQTAHSIGVIDPFGCFGSDFDYSIEHDCEVNEGGIQHVPEVDGFWLYKREELKPFDGKFEIPQQVIDSNITDPHQMMDASDCVVQVAEFSEKLTCMKIDNFQKLLEKEPGLRKCLKPEALKDETITGNK